MVGPIGIIGKSGQVARALQEQASARNQQIIARGRPDVDLANPASISAFLDGSKPSLVINAAAYTAVDKAESERDSAFAVNAHGTGALATACAARNTPLIHISTDYVFDGTKNTPYVEDDLRKPMSVYGASKAAGEVAVASAAPRHIIIRTAWVYSIDGPSFVHTMLRLGRERETLAVVSDQHGTPTLAKDIAAAILDIATRTIDEPQDASQWGTYHLTGGGATTWHGFANAIFEHARRAGLKTPQLNAITTPDYPTPARRPANSVLDCSKIARVFGIRPPPWDQTLAQTIDEILARHQKP